MASSLLLFMTQAVTSTNFDSDWARPEFLTFPHSSCGTGNRYIHVCSALQVETSRKLWLGWLGCSRSHPHGVRGETSRRRARHRVPAVRASQKKYAEVAVWQAARRWPGLVNGLRTRKNRAPKKRRGKAPSFLFLLVLASVPAKFLFFC